MVLGTKKQCSNVSYVPNINAIAQALDAAKPLASQN